MSRPKLLSFSCVFFSFALSMHVHAQVGEVDYGEIVAIKDATQNTVIRDQWRKDSMEEYMAYAIWWGKNRDPSPAAAKPTEYPRAIVERYLGKKLNSENAVLRTSSYPTSSDTSDSRTDLASLSVDRESYEQRLAESETTLLLSFFWFKRPRPPKKEPKMEDFEVYAREYESRFPFEEFIAFPDGTTMSAGEALAISIFPEHPRYHPLSNALAPSFQGYSANFPLNNPSEEYPQELRVYLKLFRSMPMDTANAHALIFDLFSTRRLPPRTELGFAKLLVEMETKSGLPSEATQKLLVDRANETSSDSTSFIDALVVYDTPETDRMVLEHYESRLKRLTQRLPHSSSIGTKYSLARRLRHMSDHFRDTSQSSENLSTLADLVSLTETSNEFLNTGLEPNEVSIEEALRFESSLIAGQTISQIVQNYVLEPPGTKKKDFLTKYLIERLNDADRNWENDNWEPHLEALLRETERLRDSGDARADDLLDALIVRMGEQPRDRFDSDLVKTIESLIEEDPEFYSKLNIYYMGEHAEFLATNPTWSGGGKNAVETLLRLDIEGDLYLYPRSIMLRYFQSGSVTLDGEGLTAALQFLNIDRNESGNLSAWILTSLKSSPPNQVTAEHASLLIAPLLDPYGFAPAALNEIAESLSLVLKGLDNQYWPKETLGHWLEIYSPTESGASETDSLYLDLLGALNSPR